MAQWFISAQDGRMATTGQSPAVPWGAGRVKDAVGHDKPFRLYPHDRESDASSWRVLPPATVPAVILGTSPTLDVTNLQYLPCLPILGVNGVVRVYVPDVWFIATKDAWNENHKYVRPALDSGCTILVNVLCWKCTMLRCGLIPIALDMWPVPDACLMSSAVSIAYLARALGFWPIYGLGMDCSLLNGRANFYERAADIIQSPIGTLQSATEPLLKEPWFHAVKEVAELPAGVPGSKAMIHSRMSAYIQGVAAIRECVLLGKDINGNAEDEL